MLASLSCRSAIEEGGDETRHVDEELRAWLAELDLLPTMHESERSLLSTSALPGSPGGNLTVKRSLIIRNSRIVTRRRASASTHSPARGRAGDTLKGG